MLMFETNVTIPTEEYKELISAQERIKAFSDFLKMKLDDSRYIDINEAVVILGIKLEEEKQEEKENEEV
mgnify:CR=1